MFPDLDACRELAPDLAADAPAPHLLADPRVTGGIRPPARRLSPRPAPARRAASCRAVLLAEPPSLDIGEMTDKGSINQRAVLAHRAALVEELYADPPPPHVIVAKQTAEVS